MSTTRRKTSSVHSARSSGASEPGVSVPSSKSRIECGVDFERDGRQVSWLKVPHSTHRSGHGSICIPIAVFRNGRGPTIFFMAGNHGDEYEGQVALLKLIRALDPATISGRVIVLPAANFPAAMAGQRTSPIDQGNLNRMFPGNPDGTATDMIAHFIGAVLMPLANLFVDLHSGGSSMEFTPYAMARLSTANTRKKEAVAALLAFDAPMSLIQGDAAENRFASSIAEQLGVVALAGEFGGGGKVSVAALAIVERGIRNLMAHLGIIEKAVPRPPGRGPSRVMKAKERTYASDTGLFEPYASLGESVVKGTEAGAIHFVDNPLRPPAVETHGGSGMVMSVRTAGLCERGDALFWVAEDYAVPAELK